MMEVTSTRMTARMKNTLQARLESLDARLRSLDGQREGDDSLEMASLIMQLERERGDVVVALRDAMLIDDEPFDTEAIEIGDLVTLRDDDGEIDRYVLVDGKVGSRARSDWVSVSSPLGAAILGRSKGDEVRVQSPVGMIGYVIVDFERASEGSLAS